jgi:ribonucleoside-diphosphate reductase alpha chain
MTAHAPFDQPFAYGIYKAKYAHPGEEWSDTAKRVTFHVMESVLPLAADAGIDILGEHADAKVRVEHLIRERQFLPGGRYLYASGRGLHQVQNCLLLRAEDTREGWSDLTRKATMALMTGAGIGVDYSDVRPSGSLISRTGGVASGPISLMKMINEVGRNVMQGGARRSAIWAGLRWDHPDVFSFIRAKDWPEWVRQVKAGEDIMLADGTVIPGDYTFPADLDMTNISVTLDREFFESYDAGDEHAREVYRLVVDKMLTTAEPGFSVDYDDHRESLRNACTEITSADDSDVCNLGSLNMARYDNIDQFGAAVRDATLFLLAGTVYSDLPYAEVYDTREKNRRLGLGVMGIHEWLLKRGRRYGPDAELGEWLAVYRDESRRAADQWSERLGLSRPIKVRAIAPTGTIGIIAETTTGIEPILAAAYKRRVRNAHHSGDTVQYEYVVDPTAKRLIDQGVDPSTIEDAYTLALDYERRIEFQAWVQQYVDHGISSTINLPEPVRDPTKQREFAEVLYSYLPRLRGVTVYPDGARGGQPLTPVDVEYALQHTGVRFEEAEERCVGGACGV